MNKNGIFVGQAPFMYLKSIAVRTGHKRVKKIEFLIIDYRAQYSVFVCEFSKNRSLRKIAQKKQIGHYNSIFYQVLNST